MSYIDVKMKNRVILQPRQVFAPDVTIQTINGIIYIVPRVYQKRPEDIWKAEGTSLFNRSNTFQGKDWEYIEVPEGTTIHEGILII